jgi:toxin ParE1/3/4
MPPFKLTAKAKSDLKNIARHTQKIWGREQRNSYLKQIDDTFHSLSDSPSLGISCDHIKPGYRKFPQGSHIIYYKPGTQVTIEIIRILLKTKNSAKRSIPAHQVLPELGDDTLRPAISLRGSRHKAGMTQVVLAAQLGIQQAHLSEMENGKRPIGKKMAMRLAKCFNCDYRVFL